LAALAASQKPALVFVGFMGAGKTTAALAADERALDTDRLLEAELGESVAEFFAREGEAAFREREEAVALDALARADGGAVALGGGSLGSERVRDALRGHTVVLLEVDPDTAWERCGQDGTRPLARDRREFGELHAQRASIYERVADAILPDSAPALVRQALPALRALADAPAGTRVVWAHSASGDYPVFAGPALLEAGYFPVPGRRYVVSDSTVFPLHGRHVEPLAGSVLIEPGERSKSLASAEQVWRGLVQQGATRDDLVVGLGGGVVGDLAGFCAATYQRGMRIVHVPTSLVAQVDSAYGGKTGVDIPEAKNYVGAYHQPAAVLVDPATLLTLPPEELSAGYAEVVKTALIAGGALWDRVREGAGGAAQPDVVLACARTKLAVVAEDERDEGRRQVLNLGHTVGHAIETAAGYGRYRHGEAVGLGLLAALRLSGRGELRDEVEALLRDHGLPIRLEGVEPPAVLEALARDKKRRADGPVPFVLVEAPGDVRPGAAVDEDDVEAAVRELLR
jgi:3-dehydroquinate synthetase/shikimate kinase